MYELKMRMDVGADVRFYGRHVLSGCDFVYFFVFTSDTEKTWVKLGLLYY